MALQTRTEWRVSSPAPAQAEAEGNASAPEPPARPAFLPGASPREAEERLPRRGRYRLRGRHARERGRLRVPVPLTVTHVGIAEDRIVLQTLRQRSVCDLDAAQVAASASMPPSVAVPALDRLVRLGLVRRLVVDGHERFCLP